MEVSGSAQGHGDMYDWVCDASGGGCGEGGMVCESRREETKERGRGEMEGRSEGEEEGVVGRLSGREGKEEKLKGRA